MTTLNENRDEKERNSKVEPTINVVNERELAFWGDRGGTKESMVAKSG